MIREARSGTGPHFSQESETFTSKVALLTARLLVLPDAHKHCQEFPLLAFLAFSSPPQSDGFLPPEEPRVSLHSRQERGWNPGENEQVAVDGERFRLWLTCLKTTKSLCSPQFSSGTRGKQCIYEYWAVTVVGKTGSGSHEPVVTFCQSVSTRPYFVDISVLRHHNTHTFIRSH